MRKLLSDVPYFLEAANCPSFTQAAEILGIPLATLSRRIAAMEKSLGVQLFFRNTRTVSLTEDGKDFLESCKIIMAEANGVKERLTQRQLEPTGPIRLSVEAFVYHCCMHGALGVFVKKYPKVELHTIFSTEWKDLHREPFDLDIRTGPVPYPELKARKLFSMQPALYCTSALLNNYPLPEHPKDLNKLPFIAQTIEGRHTATFTKENNIENVALHPKHTVQSVGLALELLLAGQGMASVIPQLAKAYDRKKELIQLLPDWSMAEVDINLAMPANNIPKRIRLFVDHLVAHFQSLQ
nr:LysR family transcriptional regulator [Desulfobacula sp.]